jgi:hypothetical protein
LLGFRVVLLPPLPLPLLLLLRLLIFLVLLLLMVAVLVPLILRPRPWLQLSSEEFAQPANSQAIKQTAKNVPRNKNWS